VKCSTAYKRDDLPFSLCACYGADEVKCWPLGIIQDWRGAQEKEGEVRFTTEA
jgi:hypothetical protein